MLVSNFSRFKDILDLEYRVLYFSIMEKTHIEIETNIMGKKGVLYMQPYNNLPLPPAVRLAEGLADDHRNCSLAVPCDYQSKIKFVRSGNAENAKSALCGL